MAPWQSTFGDYESDPHAFLFNLTCYRHLPSLQGGIFSRTNYGPCFRGEGKYSELAVINQPFNGEGQCTSYTDYSGYGIAKDKNGLNMLTN